MGVKQLLTELMANGGLDGFKGDELHLPFLLSGIVLIRKGALSAAAKMLGCVRTWGEPEIRLLKRSVEPDRLLNMVAEDVHGSFGKAECYGPPRPGLGRDSRARPGGTCRQLLPRSPGIPDQGGRSGIRGQVGKVGELGHGRTGGPCMGDAQPLRSQGYQGTERQGRGFRISTKERCP